VLFFGGGLLIPVLGLYHVGDGSFTAGVRAILEAQPERVNPIGASDSSVPFGAAVTGLVLINTFYWATNQFIVQRAFGAKSLAHAQKGVLGAGVLKMLIPIYVILPGLIAYQIFGPDLAMGDLAYPKLVELLLPKYLVGFFAAVLFGTIISSFNSGLHSASTLFGLDFYKGLLRKHATDQEIVRAGKLFGIVLAILAMIVAPMIADAASLFLLMKRINAVFNMPILAVVVMAMFTRSVPAIAAKTSLIFGMLYFIVFGIMLVDAQGSLVVGPLRIHWLYITASNFVLQCLYMYLVGRFYRNRRPYDIPLPDKSLNWKHLAWGCSGVLGLLVAAYTVQYLTARHFIDAMGGR
jgi:SSS family solute:Na+ symporter